jgi:hypothetical protein
VPASTVTKKFEYIRAVRIGVYRPGRTKTLEGEAFLNTLLALIGLFVPAAALADALQSAAKPYEYRHEKCSFFAGSRFTRESVVYRLRNLEDICYDKYPRQESNL